ncbi:class I SAM-dependent methyltransferase [Vibrio sp. HN007]|uniref:class I SAM-dependent methyltransferase n=1 Tax=Vibrio iocasae TaxID=3098914 RepID=UPI0035D509B7
MEHLLKRRNEVTLSGTKSEVKKPVAKYRTLVHSLLNRLTDSCLVILEGNKKIVFGDESAPIHGKIVVHDESFYRDSVLGGSIGAAEAYLDAKWTSPDLTQVIRIMARNQPQLEELESKTYFLSKIKNWWLRRQNLNNESGSKRNILAHYDIGNDMYQRFLDPAMQYSSAIYSPEALTLGEAQKNKMHLICQRLDIKPDDHVIEIGTGWGGLAIYMAQEIGCKVTTTTISDAQFEYAQSKVKALNLENKITLLKQDYRKLDGKYDKLVSIEMIEAVGHEFLPTFFSKCSSLLKPNGKMLIQSITIADGRYETYRKGTDFIQKYIFPGGCLPSIAAITAHMSQYTDMVVNEIQDIGLHYARTLKDWNQAFEKSWPELKQLGYSEDFRRLWLFYLCYCEGAFIERAISTHHIVARKPRYLDQNDEAVLDY